MSFSSSPPKTTPPPHVHTTTQLRVDSTPHRPHRIRITRSVARRRRHSQRFIPRPRPHWRTAHRSPPRKTKSHRACAHARTSILLLCVPSKSFRPVRRSPPLISYAFLICRHFARRVRRVLRGSAVVYIYVYIVFSPLPVRRYTVSAIRIAALLSAVRTRSEQSFRQA